MIEEVFTKDMDVQLNPNELIAISIALDTWMESVNRVYTYESGAVAEARSVSANLPANHPMQRAYPTPTFEEIVRVHEKVNEVEFEPAAVEMMRTMFELGEQKVAGGENFSKLEAHRDALIDFHRKIGSPYGS